METDLQQNRFIERKKPNPQQSLVSEKIKSIVRVVVVKTIGGNKQKLKQYSNITNLCVYFKFFTFRFQAMTNGLMKISTFDF